MAFPTAPTVAGGRILWTLNSAGGTTKTFPNLSGLTKNSGDLLIAVCVCYTGGSTNADFSAWGGSFTEFCDLCTATTMAVGAAYKWSTGSETGTFTVTTVNSASSVQCLMSIAGAHASNAPVASPITYGTTTAANPGAWGPGWTEDTLWIVVGGSGEVSTSGTYTGISAAPANYTDLALSGITADVAGGLDAAVAFRQLNSATTDIGTFTMDLSNTRNVLEIIAVRPAVPPSITQAAYRFYDQGTESGSVALQPQDTAHTGDLTGGDGLGHLRVRLQSTTAVAIDATDDFTLQYEKNTSGTWVNVGTGAVIGYNDPNLTDAAATTNRLGAGTGSFVAGKVSEDGLADNVGWTANNYTELLFSCQFVKAQLISGDTIRFRVLRNGATTGMTYTQTPLVNIIQVNAYNETNKQIAIVAGVSLPTDQTDYDQLDLLSSAVAVVAVTDVYRHREVALSVAVTSDISISTVGHLGETERTISVVSAVSPLDLGHSWDLDRVVGISSDVTVIDVFETIVYLTRRRYFARRALITYR